MRMNPLDDVLGLLGITGTPEENMDQTALQLSQQEPVNLDQQWWLETYATGFGPWALLFALFVSVLVLLTNLGPNGSRLKILLSPVIYAETLVVYFLMPLIQQGLIEASRQVTHTLLPLVFEVDSAGASLWDNWLANLAGTRWVQTASMLATELITVFASVLDRLLYAIPYVLIMAWPFRYLGEKGASTLSSVIRLDFVILLTAPVMLFMLAISKIIIANGPDEVITRRYATMVALLLTAYVPFWLSNQLKQSGLIKGIKNTVHVRGNVEGGGTVVQRSTPERRASRFSNMQGTANDLSVRERNMSWMMEKPANFAKVVFAKDPKARAAIAATSWLAGKIKK